MTTGNLRSRRFDVDSSLDEGQAVVTALLDRAAEFCYRLFCDAEAVPRWLDVVDSVDVRVRGADGRALEAAFVGELEGGPASYTLCYAYDDEARRVSWRQLEGEDTTLSGSAQFMPRDGGCLLRYSLRAESAEGRAWADELYRQRPADAVVLAFCEWVCHQAPAPDPPDDD